MLQIVGMFALVATSMGANIERTKRGVFGEHQGYSYEQPQEQVRTVHVPQPYPVEVIKEVVKHIDRPVPQVSSE